MYLTTSPRTLGPLMRVNASPFIRGSRQGVTAGFTMIELAVAIVIIALLLGSILVPLSTQVESRKYDETQRILEQAREALIGFAAATGRLPCPASISSNGSEHFSVGGGPGNGLCDSSVTGPVGTNIYVGFLPAATLGFTPVDSNGYAIDAWSLQQNRIRYAVSYQPVNGIFNPFTTLSTASTGMRAAGMSNILADPPPLLLYVCNSAAGVTATNCGTATTLAKAVPAVIWSVGPNAPTVTGGCSNDEKQNPHPNPVPGCAPIVDRVFVSKTKSGQAGDTNEFDDVVTWIGAPTLFNRMIAAGQLP